MAYAKVNERWHNFSYHIKITKNGQGPRSKILRHKSLKPLKRRHGRALWSLEGFCLHGGYWNWHGLEL